MIYRFSPRDLEAMYEVIKGVPESTFVAAYMSQVTGEFYMDDLTKKILDEYKVEYDLLEEIDPKTVSVFYANPVTIDCSPYDEKMAIFSLANSRKAKQVSLEDVLLKRRGSRVYRTFLWRV